MKFRLFTRNFLLMLFLTVSTGCGGVIASPTVTTIPTPSMTPQPTTTPVPTLTTTPTIMPSDTPNPDVERDLKPAYIETITQTYMGVDIKFSVITDESIGTAYPPVNRIYLNPNFRNSKGEKSEQALAHFTALIFYKLWRTRQVSTQANAFPDFESFLLLWSQAQKSNDPADWEKVQIKNIMVNDLTDGNGYQQKSTTLWPMYNSTPSQIPEGVRTFNEFAIAYVRVSRVKNVALTTSGTYGAGTNIDINTLYVYLSFPGGDYAGGWSITGTLPDALWCLKSCRFGSNGGADIDLYKLVNQHTNPGDCCFRTALKLDPPTRYDKIYNP